MIKVLFKDIGSSQGLDIEQTIPKEGIGLSDEEIDLRSPLAVKAHLSWDDHTVVADVHVKVDFGCNCARCLEDMKDSREFTYRFEFPQEPGAEYVDLGEEIRQELIMAMPARVLCKDDCKGICPKCGLNLNIEPCKCK